MIHADNAVSWHNQDIEDKHEEYYCSASCGGISHLKKISVLPLLVIERRWAVKRSKNGFTNK